MVPRFRESSLRAGTFHATQGPSCSPVWDDSPGRRVQPLPLALIATGVEPRVTALRGGGAVLARLLRPPTRHLHRLLSRLAPPGGSRRREADSSGL